MDQRWALAPALARRLVFATVTLGVLDAAVFAMLPLIAWTLGARASIGAPIAVTLFVGAVRAPIARAHRRHLRPALMRETLRHVTDLAGLPETRSEALFWALFHVERLALQLGPTALGAGVAVTLSAALAMGRLDAIESATAVVAVVAGVAVWALRQRRLRPLVESARAGRGEVSAYVSAAVRDRGELLRGTGRIALIGHANAAADEWLVREERFEHAARRLKAFAIAATLLPLLVTWSAAHEYARSPLRLLNDHDALATVALAVAFIAPLRVLTRAVEEMYNLREQFRAVGYRSLPAWVDGTVPITLPAVLTVADASFHFAEHCALDRVGFALQLPGVLAVVGPNGAGKTTLAALLAGVLAPSAGSVRIGDVDLTDADPNAIAFVPQDPVLVESLSVAQNVRLVAPNASDSQIARALADFGADPTLDRRCEQLSRGEQRRIAMVRAVLKGPQLLILDEPDAWLDTAGREALRAMIARERCVRGVLIVTHRMEFARGADCVVLLGNDHKARAVGTFSDLAASAAIVEKELVA